MKRKTIAIIIAVMVFAVLACVEAFAERPANGKLILDGSAVKDAVCDGAENFEYDAGSKTITYGNPFDWGWCVFDDTIKLKNFIVTFHLNEIVDGGFYFRYSENDGGMKNCYMVGTNGQTVMYIAEYKDGAFGLINDGEHDVEGSAVATVMAKEDFENETWTVVMQDEIVSFYLNQDTEPSMQAHVTDFESGTFGFQAKGMSISNFAVYEIGDGEYVPVDTEANTSEEDTTAVQTEDTTAAGTVNDTEEPKSTSTSDVPDVPTAESTSAPDTTSDSGKGDGKSNVLTIVLISAAVVIVAAVIIVVAVKKKK